MRSDHADVAIVGAGPAGAWTAYELAQAGARVTLFDGSHPREKPCGGGVTGRALSLVAPALRRPLPAVTIDSARFEVDHARAAVVPLRAHGLSPETDLLVASRRDFDQALLGCALDAGVRLVPARVLDVAVHRHGAEARTAASTHLAGAIVGADGANSLVRRRLLRPFTRAQLSIATGYFASQLTSREIVIRFVARPPGYLWSFPRPDHLSVGICAPADCSQAAPLRALVAHWIRETGIARDARLVPYAWPIPTLSAADLARDRPAGPRWLLVGDAAGLVDPITREGIFFALQSAALAARTLCDRPQALADDYFARLRGEIHPELERAAGLKRRFFAGPFTRLLVDALARSPAIRRVTADVMAGRQPYRGLARRLAATFEIGVAWHLLRLGLRSIS